MSIKHKIKFKEQAEKKEKLHEKDRPRFEEQDEEEYRKQLKKFLKEKMKTIPDAIDDVKEWWRKIIDTVYGVIEHHSVKLSSWSWQKRWGNRDRGTGYSRDYRE